VPPIESDSESESELTHIGNPKRMKEYWGGEENLCQAKRHKPKRRPPKREANEIGDANEGRLRTRRVLFIR